MRREPVPLESESVLCFVGFLAGLVLFLGGCFPVAFSQRVPAVPDGLLPATGFADPLEDVLVLVVWRDETYRWSGSNTVRPSFLAPPHVVKAQELAQLDDIAKKYRNYGVAAWDGHGGTVHQDKEPASLYLIPSTGRIEWLVSLQNRSTDWRLRWQRHAWTNLGEGWRLRLHEVMGSCKRLTRAGGPCGFADTPLAASLLEADSELLLELSEKQIDLIRLFLSQFEHKGTTHEETVDKWQLYEGT